MKSKDIFTVNRRVMVFIILGLCLVDILFCIIVSNKFNHPECQRLPSYDYSTLKLWINQIEKSNGYKIVVLGDSVVHGDAVKYTCDTLPAYISKELNELLPDKNIRVFNIGIAGAAPAEVYFILNALESIHVDLFIYDINLGWFSRTKPLEHLSLLEFNNNLSSEQLHLLGLDPLVSTISPIEKWLSRNILNHWKVYDQRILLNYWLFGKPLREKLQDAKRDPSLLLPFSENKLPEILEMRAPWKEKKWEGKLDPTKGRVGSFYLNNSNKQWLFYKMLLDYIKDKEIQAVFFITPRNHELLECYDMIDKPNYINNLSIIINEAKNKTIPVLNYDSAIPFDYFSDTVHLLPEGNKILASSISHDLIEKGYIKR
ncbi:hypothetical protein PTH_1215 [Pelotomaculum thermopropionicum SI]|uniref:Uncharacterized protein n=1 Tax=Pelotomaculum thermopropionicum (strain DSM 13744 / JCM 10971 / SI) TaxID=370438 RepID=A5D2X4_PELTS|nr:hypothetical protein PTH_1215 [Pelotomaculum thermopropionicum SI]